MQTPIVTAEDCLAKAAEMERLANEGPPEIHDSYLKMASEWRILAAQVAWHVGSAGPGGPAAGAGGAWAPRPSRVEATRR